MPHTLAKTHTKCHFPFKIRLPVAFPPVADHFVCARVCMCVLSVNFVRHFPLTFPIFRALMQRQTHMHTRTLFLLLLLTHYTCLLFIIVRHIKWISGSLWALPPPHRGIFSYNCLASVALGRENLTRESSWVRLFPRTTITAKVHLDPNWSTGAVRWLAVQDRFSAEQRLSVNVRNCVNRKQVVI